MIKGKILFIDSAHPLLRQSLEADGYRCDEFPEYNRAALKAILHNYIGIIARSKIQLNRDFLESGSQLKFIGRVGAGMENIDQEFAESKGMVCLNAPEGNRDAVAEHALGMLLMLFNNLRTADAEVRQGKWNREDNRGIELGGKTVAIIGYGNTGGAFARKLNGCGVKVLAYDKYKTGFGDTFAEESGMEEIFRQADILSLHVPLSRETSSLVNRKYLENFNKPIWLVNTARGKVVNTSDLIVCIELGQVLGACLDVLEFEGPSFEKLASGGHPDSFTRLTQLPNVVLSPHIAGWTHESHEKLARTLVEKIRKLDL